MARQDLDTETHGSSLGQREGHESRLNMWFICSVQLPHRSFPSILGPISLGRYKNVPSCSFFKEELAVQSQGMWSADDPL